MSGCQAGAGLFHGSGDSESQAVACHSEDKGGVSSHSMAWDSHSESPEPPRIIGPQGQVQAGWLVLLKLSMCLVGAGKKTTSSSTRCWASTSPEQKSRQPMRMNIRISIK